AAAQVGHTPCICGGARSTLLCWRFQSPCAAYRVVESAVWRIRVMNPGKPGRPVVFLDRDGTLNEEIGYIRDLSKLVLIEGAAAAVRRLNESKVAAVLITNQSGAARGHYSGKHTRAPHSAVV